MSKGRHSQLNALTQLGAKQHDPGDYTKIIAGDYTNSSLSTASDYTNINRYIAEGFTTFNYPNLETKILLFTSEIFKTKSLSFLKNNS